MPRDSEHEFAPVLSLLFSTGMGRGEALALTWGDVEFDSRRIWVRRALLQQGFSAPKSGKAHRVPMTEGLAEDLFEVLATSRAVSTERGVDAPP